MASIINASSTGSGGIVQTADASGVLQLQSNGTTAAFVDTNANLNVSNSLNAPNTFGFKNRIINGAVNISQYNGTSSVTVGAVNPAYYIDRWAVTSSVASKLSIQQLSSSPPVGFSNYIGFTSLSAYSIGTSDYFSLQQRIEGFNFADLQWGTANAKKVTLSFWVQSSLTGTFGGSLVNSAGNRFYPFTYTISAANTWQQISVTIAGDTTGTWVGATNGIGLTVSWGLGIGSGLSTTAGAWTASTGYGATGATSVVGTNGATFYITGVQLEVGSSATGYEYRQYGTELDLCQRYYQTSFNWAGYCNNAGTSVGGLVYGCQFMRTVPTIGLNGPFNITDTYTADYQQSSANISGTIGGSNNSYFVFMGNFTGLVSTRGYIARMNQSVAYNPITLSAEL